MKNFSPPITKKPPTCDVINSIKESWWRPLLPSLLTTALLLPPSFAQGEICNNCQTLSQTVQQALETDATLAAAHQLRRQSGYQIDSARAVLLPQVSLNLGYGQHHEQGRGLTAERQSGYTHYEQQSASLELSQALFNAADWYRYQAAQSADQQAQVALEAARQDLILRSSQAWFDVLRQQDALNTHKNELDALQQDWQQTRYRHAAGLVVALEVQEAQSRIDLTRAALLQSRNNLQLARLQLQQLTGIETAELAPLTYLPLLPHHDVQHWLALANQHNPALRQNNAAELQARLDWQASRAEHLPTVTLQASLSREIEDAWKYSDDNTGLPLDTNSRYIGIEIAVPIYEGGGLHAGRRAAAAGLAYQQQQSRLQQQILTTRIHSLHAQLENQQASIQARQQALHSANQTLAATEAAWRTGLRRFVDVLDARQQQYEAYRDLSASHYDYLTSWLSLHREAGVLDTSVISRLEQALQNQPT